jgi:Lon protease-like protein
MVQGNGVSAGTAWKKSIRAPRPTAPIDSRSAILVVGAAPVKHTRVVKAVVWASAPGDRCDKLARSQGDVTEASSSRRPRPSHAALAIPRIRGRECSLGTAEAARAAWENDNFSWSPRRRRYKIAKGHQRTVFPKDDAVDNESLGIPESYSGLARLFPLPNLVLFPGIIQPLHLFEPRYVQLIEDAIAGDGLIAMAHLRPGWEPSYDRAPPIYPTVCLGRIMTYSRLEDGRYNMLLRGLRRGRVVREIASDRLYRLAQVQLVPQATGEGEADMSAVEVRLRRQFLQFCRHDASLDFQAIESLLNRPMPLENLIDLIAFSLDVAPELKQAVLEADSLVARLRWVARELDQSLARRHVTDASVMQSRFPPVFSAN